MEAVKCLSCGFVSHFISSDGVYAVYQCERCGYTFKIKI